MNEIQAEATHKGLMYVELLTYGQKIVALIDGKANYNFISPREATRLSLKLTKDDSEQKVVNSLTQQTHGLNRQHFASYSSMRSNFRQERQYLNMDLLSSLDPTQSAYKKQSIMVCPCFLYNIPPGASFK